MHNKYLTGEIKKCSSCNGKGYSESENHPDCYMCSGNGYIQLEGGIELTLKELKDKLDTYLQGNWYEIDYLLSNARTKIFELEDNSLLVKFGDNNTLPHCKNQLVLHLKNNRIERVENISVYELAYDDKVIKDIIGLKLALQ